MNEKSRGKLGGGDLLSISSPPPPRGDATGLSNRRKRHSRAASGAVAAIGKSRDWLIRQQYIHGGQRVQTHKVILHSLRPAGWTVLHA